MSQQNDMLSGVLVKHQLHLKLRFARSFVE